ncbi:hypothetical protein C8Q69DRAFT_215826 [Paecilomyces variotii]|uniref:Uncharacterized protein n=1 Tax=Byssochlamys spectabilis TaxID=264951 RepID=A0A443HZB5_BYSSP|nr:hypothetical protein C8Q69DRAFT_215826 [Paecilomyces variotii]RWQ97110.1 hypothetical protein C8Q69DRAFT_215826 [Paecilomyces variotii]
MYMTWKKLLGWAAGGLSASAARTIMDQLLDVGRYEPELASAGGRQHNSRVQGDRERVEQHDPSVSARFESRDSDHHREPPFAVLIWNAADLLFHHGRYRWYTCHHGSSCLPPTTRAVESKPCITDRQLLPARGVCVGRLRPHPCPMMSQQRI